MSNDNQQTRSEADTELPPLTERLAAFFRMFWKDNTPEEARQLWQRYVQMSPIKGAETLATLDAVIADPPPDLPKIIQENGWVSLYHMQDPNHPVLFNYEEHLHWLKDMTAQFRLIYEAKLA